MDFFFVAILFKHTSDLMGHPRYSELLNNVPVMFLQTKEKEKG